MTDLNLKSGADMEEVGGIELSVRSASVGIHIVNEAFATPCPECVTTIGCHLFDSRQR